MTNSETWKDVVGFEGLYKVSNKGNIYSVERRDSRGNRCGGRILKTKYGGKGYRQVNMYKNGKSKTTFVHRIVADAFIPNPENLPQVNHIDEDKDNNNVKNLEWCTHKHNMNHGTLKERTAQALSKKVKATNIKTGEFLTFNSAKEAEREGYGSGAVSMACRGVYKTSAGKLVGDGRTYKGFRWSYEDEEENESKQAWQLDSKEGLR